MRSFLLYLAISLLTLVLISSSSTALAQSEHLERGLGPSGVVKLSGLRSPAGLAGPSASSGFLRLPSAPRFRPRLHLAGGGGLASPSQRLPPRGGLRGRQAMARGVRGASRGPRCSGAGADRPRAPRPGRLYAPRAPPPRSRAAPGATIGPCGEPAGAGAGARARRGRRRRRGTPAGTEERPRGRGVRREAAGTEPADATCAPRGGRGIGGRFGGARRGRWEAADGASPIGQAGAASDWSARRGRPPRWREPGTRKGRRPAASGRAERCLQFQPEVVRAETPAPRTPVPSGLCRLPR